MHKFVFSDTSGNGFSSNESYFEVSVDGTRIERVDGNFGLQAEIIINPPPSATSDPTDSSLATMDTPTAKPNMAPAPPIDAPTMVHLTSSPVLPMNRPTSGPVPSTTTILQTTEPTNSSAVLPTDVPMAQPTSSPTSFPTSAPTLRPAVLTTAPSPHEATIPIFLVSPSSTASPVTEIDTTISSISGQGGSGQASFTQSSGRNSQTVLFSSILLLLWLFD